MCGWCDNRSYRIICCIIYRERRNIQAGNQEVQYNNDVLICGKLLPTDFGPWVRVS